MARQYGFSNWTTLKARVESAEGVGGKSPFVNMWTANLVRSKRHPQNPFQSATLRFSVDANAVRITHVVVDESGKEERAENTIQVDGVEHQDPTRPEYTVVANWRGSNVLEVVGKRKSDVIGIGTYKVHTDGKTLTVEDANGDQHLVFDRA